MTDRGRALNALANGNYQLTIQASEVMSTTSSAMAADAVFGNSFADDFFSLFGDGDGDVDGTDYVSFHRAQTVYRAEFDINGDGVVDTSDLSIGFIGNYGKRRRVF